jgi:hypothetical protein
MAKAEFNNKTALFACNLSLSLRKKLVKCYTWSITFYDAEPWALQKVMKCGGGEGWRISVGPIV